MILISIRAIIILQHSLIFFSTCILSVKAYALYSCANGNCVATVGNAFFGALPIDSAFFYKGEFFMNENKEKSLIIAKRIQLKFIADLIASCVIFVIFLGLLVLCIWIDSLVIIFIVGLFLVGFSIYAFFYFRNIYLNNKSNAILITYKNDIFTIVDDIEPLNIIKSDIVDLKYKLKKTFIVTPYFYSSKTWNYGKLIIYFKSEEQGYKTIVKNVADVDKVFDKMIDMLGWNTIDEEEIEI